jgi:hypothetical protein
MGLECAGLTPSVAQMNAPGTRSLVGLALLVSLAACETSNEEPTTHRNVDAVCVEETPADEAWTCDETRTIACEDLDDDNLELEVQLEEGACDGADLEGVEGPFEVGTHTIDITDAATGDTVCSAQLEITDEHAPEATTEVVDLWPPNHKLHTVTLDDCITEVDDCDDDVDARILWVSSDAPDNDTSDGNTSDDIVITADDAVSVRAERRGDGNGRVYTIGFELRDDADNVAEGECAVWVRHDQSGSDAIDDGAAYTIEAE